MSGTFFATNSRAFRCNGLWFETYKDWIRGAFSPDDPVLLKVFERTEEGFDDWLDFSELNEVEFQYCYRRLRSLDSELEKLPHVNPAYADLISLWQELLKFLANDERMSTCKPDTHSE